MTFKELGFSDATTNEELVVSSYIDTVRLFFNLSFNLSEHFLTDRQCAKKMLLKRNPELAFTFKEYNGSDSKINSPGQSRLSPDWTAFRDFDKTKADNDREANRAVFGTPLSVDPEFAGRESEFEVPPSPVYAQWTNDNEEVFPNIVTKDDSNDKYLDSPSKPLAPENEIFEQIYFFKKKLNNNFQKLEHTNITLNEDLEYLLELISKGFSFKNLSYHVPEDYVTPLTSTGDNPLSDFSSAAYSPITSHNNFSVSGVYSIFQSCKRIIVESRRRIFETTSLLTYTQYLDFIIKPTSTEQVNKFLSDQISLVNSNASKFELISNFVNEKLSLIEAAQVKLQALDTQLQNSLISTFAVPPVPPAGPNPFSTQRSLYQSLRVSIENDKQDIIDSLNRDLGSNFSNLKSLVKS